MNELPATGLPNENSMTLTARKNNKGRAARRRYCKARSVQEAIRKLLRSRNQTDAADNDNITETDIAADLNRKIDDCWAADRQWTLPSVLRRRREYLGHSPIAPELEPLSDNNADTEGQQDEYWVSNSGTTMTNLLLQEHDPAHLNMHLTDVHTITSQLGFLPGNAIAVVARLRNLVQSDLYPNLTRLLTQFQKQHDNLYNHDDDEWIMNTPLVLMLYPLALRGEHPGGKAKGSKFKSRKRSSVLSSSAVDITVNSSHSQAVVVVEPFPTLYWLTHPLLKLMISHLEFGHSSLNIQTLEQRLNSNPLYLEEMKKSHFIYGQKRTNLIASQDWEYIITPRKWNSALGAHRGIAGILNPGKIKCLHAHAAQYLAHLPCLQQHYHHFQDIDNHTPIIESASCLNTAQNLVGQWTLQALEEMVLNNEFDF